MKASVIISFYNKVSFLKLLLAGFERQSNKDFEIIISDDGSSDSAVAEVQKLIESSPLDINHIWHEDRGWQKNVILNKSIVATKSNYLIFVDGDCIPHKHFVKDHLRNQEKNVIVAGRRVNLGQKLSSSLTAKNVYNGILENVFRILFQNKDGGSHLEKAFRNPFALLNTFFDSYGHGLLGCNFSMFKEDIIRVNGFDERYVYPCVGEDTDLEERFLMIKGKVKRVKHAAIQYHLWHKMLSRDDQPKNMLILNETIAQQKAYTDFGINKVK